MVDRSPAAAEMSGSPTTGADERRHWWQSTKKTLEKYVREARAMIASRDPAQINSALSLLDSVLTRSPRFELASELKARCLLYLRRFGEVADMLHDYIPSYKVAVQEDENSSRDRVKLLGDGDDSENDSLGSKCFSLSELKRKFLAGLCRNAEKEGHWRYLVLGQACCHLGLMEDAMLLLQTAKRLATAAFRRESICWADDSFSSNSLHLLANITTNAATHHQPTPTTELEMTTQILSQIKLLLRRRAAALAALDVGLYAESIRHFSKILDGRRPAPQAFLAECYLHRATAYLALGRVAESIADCNRTLALNPSYIRALEDRSSLFEMIGCIADALHDLEHLKLLFNSILRDRKLPGPGCKPQAVAYREVPGKLCVLTAKIEELKQRIANGDKGNVDYYKLTGLRRGCSRSELERTQLLLVIRHKPDKAVIFIDRCELINESDHDSVRDRARLSALLLYRLIQKGHSALMAAVTEDEAVEAQRSKAVLSIQETSVILAHQQQVSFSKPEQGQVYSASKVSGMGHDRPQEPNAGLGLSSQHGPSFQGGFCRDLVVVGNLLSQAGFNRSLSVKYEALSC